MPEWASWWYPPLAALGVTTGADLLRRVHRRINDLRAIDHLPIQSGWFGRQDGLQDCARVFVACAPNDSLRDPGPPRGSVAEQFVADTFPGVVDPRVLEVGQRFCRFESSGDNSLPPSIVLIWDTGKIEASITLPSAAEDREKTLLPVTSAARWFLALSQASESGRVRELLGITKHQRLDWYFGVAQRWIHASSQREWVGVEFPGREPGFRARRLVTPIAGLGFGWEALRNQPQSARGTALLSFAITDLLSQVGYQDFNEALSDIVAEASRQVEVD